MPSTWESKPSELNPYRPWRPIDCRVTRLTRSNMPSAWESKPTELNPNRPWSPIDCRVTRLTRIPSSDMWSATGVQRALQTGNLKITLWTLKPNRNPKARNSCRITSLTRIPSSDMWFATGVQHARQAGNLKITLGTPKSRPRTKTKIDVVSLPHLCRLHIGPAWNGSMYGTTAGTAIAQFASMVLSRKGKRANRLARCSTVISRNSKRTTLIN